MNRRLEIVRLLADGREHSGEVLATALEVSRAAVWKQVRQLDEWQLDVEAAVGRGYRLTTPVELLDAEAVRSALPDLARERLRHLRVEAEVGSTNEALLAIDDLPVGRFDAFLAEFQTSGRGRRGRAWIAPFASGLCLSVNWCFAETPGDLSALSLAAGVAVRRALALRGITGGVGLKWPNDIMLDSRKLGGILCELRAEAGGPAYVVIGIGLNLRLPATARAAIAASGQQAASLADIEGLALPSRSELAACLIGQLALVFEEFSRRGFQPFVEEWSEADQLKDQAVEVQRARETLRGMARGIDRDGALLLEIDGRRQRVISGEVSLRPAAC